MRRLCTECAHLRDPTSSSRARGGLGHINALLVIRPYSHGVSPEASPITSSVYSRSHFQPTPPARPRAAGTSSHVAERTGDAVHRAVPRGQGTLVVWGTRGAQGPSCHPIPRAMRNPSSSRSPSLLRTPGGSARWPTWPLQTLFAKNSAQRALSSGCSQLSGNLVYLQEPLLTDSGEWGPRSGLWASCCEASMAVQLSPSPASSVLIPPGRPVKAHTLHIVTPTHAHICAPRVHAHTRAHTRTHTHAHQTHEKQPPPQPTAVRMALCVQTALDTGEEGVYASDPLLFAGGRTRAPRASANFRGARLLVQSFISKLGIRKLKLAQNVSSLQETGKTILNVKT